MYIEGREVAAMRMIRKQLYIAEQQQRKLERLAAGWGCTEAHVMRTALDRLTEPTADLETQVRDRLRMAGLLVEAADDPDLPRGAEADAFENEMEQWLNAQTEPLGLAQAVLEDRR
jgi:hypothetical protein